MIDTGNEKNNEAVSAGGIHQEIFRGERIVFNGSNTQRPQPSMIGSMKETNTPKGHDKRSDSESINDARRLEVFLSSNPKKSHITKGQNKIKRQDQVKIGGGGSEANHMQLNIRSFRAKKATEGGYVLRGMTKAAVEKLRTPPPPSPSPLLTPPPANILSEKRDDHETREPRYENVVSLNFLTDNNSGRDRSSEPPKDLRCESALCFDACCGLLFVGMSNDIEAGGGNIHTSVAALRAGATKWIEATYACPISHHFGECQRVSCQPASCQFAVIQSGWACGSPSELEGNDDVSVFSGRTKGTSLSMHAVEWTDVNFISGDNNGAPSQSLRKSRWRQLFKRRAMKLSTPTTNVQPHDATEEIDDSNTRSFKSTLPGFTRVNDKNCNILAYQTNDGDMAATTELGAVKLPEVSGRSSMFDQNYRARDVVLACVGTDDTSTPSCNTSASESSIGVVKLPEVAGPSSVFDQNYRARDAGHTCVGTDDTSTPSLKTSASGPSIGVMKLPDVSDSSSVFDQNYRARDVALASLGTGDTSTPSFKTSASGPSIGVVKLPDVSGPSSVFDQNYRARDVVLACVGTDDRPTSDSVEITGHEYATDKNDGSNAVAKQLGANKRISLFRKYLNKRTSKVESAHPTHLKPYNASGESEVSLRETFSIKTSWD